MVRVRHFWLRANKRHQQATPSFSSAPTSDANDRQKEQASAPTTSFSSAPTSDANELAEGAGEHADKRRQRARDEAGERANNLLLRANNRHLLCSLRSRGPSIFCARAFRDNKPLNLLRTTRT